MSRGSRIRLITAPVAWGDHGEDGLAGGLEEPFKADLEHHTHADHRYDGEIGGAVADDGVHLGLERHEGAGEEAAQHGEDGPGAEGQEHAVDGSLVGGLKIFLSQALGEQGVDAHAGAHGH